MAVIKLYEPSAAVLQNNIYNSNVGGQLNLRSEFNGVPAGTAWAVIGCVFAPDPVTPAMITGTLNPGLEALAEVTSVNGDQLLGQIPATIEATDHEPNLHVTVNASSTIDGAGGFTKTNRTHDLQTVPLGKWWCVVIIRVPSELDPTKIATLETAVETISGVTTCVHLVDGIVSSRASNANLTVASHVRIEPIEV
jgi:hypothetical protein